MDAVYRLMFVCLGNICRSPLAEALCAKEAAEMGMKVEVASSGTDAYHQGATADRRMRATARRHGVEIRSRSSLFSAEMASAYHLILAMDRSNYYQIRRIVPTALFQQRVRMLRDFDPEGPGEVSDPYYGGAAGFEAVFAVVERSCRALLEQLRDHGLAL